MLEKKEDTKSKDTFRLLKKTLEITGIFILFLTTIEIFSNYQKMGEQQELIQFLYPIVFSTISLPLIFLCIVFSIYDRTIRFNIHLFKNQSKKFPIFWFLVYFNINFIKVDKFNKLSYERRVLKYNSRHDLYRICKKLNLKIP